MSQLITLGKKSTIFFFNEVKEDLKFFISNVPKYSSNYSTEKDTTNMWALAPWITKQALFEEFLKYKNYKFSKNWFLKYWAENMRVKVNYVDKNHVDTCHISNSIAIAGD